MRQDGWYVIQVETGHEQKACDAILRTCAGQPDANWRGVPLVSECFAPRYCRRFKLHGSWHDEECLLLPGYVVAVTSSPWELARALWEVPGFMHLVRAGETFVPLFDEDRSWIERWTKEGKRIIPMSVAYKVGDKIVVTDGPLKGHEAMIRKVRRRLCLAELEIHAGQKTIRTTVGLAVLPKLESSEE